MEIVLLKWKRARVSNLRIKFFKFHLNQIRYYPMNSSKLLDELLENLDYPVNTYPRNKSKVNRRSKFLEISLKWF